MMVMRRPWLLAMLPFATLPFATLFLDMSLEISLETSFF
jgi:hypothetical protein